MSECAGTSRLGLMLGRDIGVELLADELNQFAMAVETFASEHPDGHVLFKAARRLRERIVELIPS